MKLVPESTLPDEQRDLRVMPLLPAAHREFGLVCSKTEKASQLTLFLSARGDRQEHWRSHRLTFR